MSGFDYSLDYANLDLRKQPALYRIGRGEQGVLLVEPYKSEILPYWRFKTVSEARHSAATIYDLFERYKAADDFVGMDMARKFLQMGYTRARRYANHPSGRKYAQNTERVLPQARDALTGEKAAAARLFRAQWLRVRGDSVYAAAKRRHRDRYEHG